jgi:hypothetical protein
MGAGREIYLSLPSPDGSLLEVVAALSQDEIADCVRHFRGGNGPGVPNGPLPRAYALNRATRLLPPNFKPVLDEIQLVQ